MANNKKKIVEHNKAPSKQLIEVANRSRCKRIWHDNTKLTFAKARWKSPYNALWKNPTYIYLGSRMCLCLFSQKEKIWTWHRGCRHPTEEFQRRLQRGPWSGLPCPQGEECLITEPATPLCRVSSCLQSPGRPAWDKCQDVLQIAESSSPHPGIPPALKHKCWTASTVWTLVCFEAKMQTKHQTVLIFGTQNSF